MHDHSHVGPTLETMFEKLFEEMEYRGNPEISVEPTAVYRNGDYTTVLWQDGTKTVVKRKDGDPDDPYAAFTAALAKHVYGGSTTVKTMLKKITKEQKPKKKPAKPTETLPGSVNPAAAKIPWEAN